MQSDGSTGHARTAYAAVLDTIAADAAPLIDALARDVAGPDEAVADVATEVAPALARLLELLGVGPDTPPGEASRLGLREEGAAAARSGVSVERVIDRYLSAGWVVWAAATTRTAEPATLAELGAALLRTGDLAGAEIAAGHGAASRDIAGRAATARAELLEMLLAVPSLGPGAAALVERAASRLGLDAHARYRVMVAAADPMPEPDLVTAALSRPSRAGVPRSPVLVGVRQDRLVAIVPDAMTLPSLAAALGRTLGRGWVAATDSAMGLAAVAGAYAAGLSALRVAQRHRQPEMLVDARDVLLERALLVDDRLLEAAVRRELGAIDAAPRGGPALVDTLEAWLANGQNVRATARALSIAARTVSYRLERIERLLGHRLEGTVVPRLAVALFARGLATGSPDDVGSG